MHDITDLLEGKEIKGARIVSKLDRIAHEKQAGNTKIQHGC